MSDSDSLTLTRPLSTTTSPSSLPHNTSHPKPPLHINIAILLNSHRSPHLPAITGSYTRTLLPLSHLYPHTLTFFNPAHDEHLPDPDEFDLIIIGGGNVDPRKKHPWILRVQKYVLELIEGIEQGRWHRKGKNLKVVGICWGHQTMGMIGGGAVVECEVPEVRGCFFGPCWGRQMGEEGGETKERGREG
jgi:hypothetical protein